MSNRKDTKFAIISKDESLLIKSSITQNQDIILDLIDREPRAILKDLSIEEHNYISNTYPKVLKAAISEWDILPNNIEIGKSRDFKCEICGRSIKYIFKIKNRLNKNVLKIGSECVKHFGIGTLNDINSMVKTSREIYHFRLLNEKFPGIERKVDNWDRFIDNQIYFFSDKDIQTYYDVGRSLKSLISLYQKQGISIDKRLEIEDKISCLLNKGDDERDKIIKIVESYLNDMFAPKKEYIKDVLAFKREELREIFSKYGRVTKSAAWRINSKEFTKQVVLKIDKLLRLMNFKPERITNHDNKVGVILKSDKLKSIELFCPHDKIVEIFVEEIYDQDVHIPPNIIEKKSDLIRALSITNFEDMAQIVILGLRVIGFQYTVYSNKNIDYEYNEIYVFDKGRNLYYQLSLTESSRLFLSVIYNETLVQEDKIKNYINQKGKIIEKEDINNLFRDRKRNYDINYRPRY